MIRETILKASAFSRETIFWCLLTMQGIKLAKNTIVIHTQLVLLRYPSSQGISELSIRQPYCVVHTQKKAQI